MMMLPENLERNRIRDLNTHFFFETDNLLEYTFL